MIEATKQGMVDATHHVADPRFAPVPVDAMLAHTTRVIGERASAPKAAAWGRSDTVYLAATDAEGNEKMARFTRELIDLSLQVGGRFFLPYQLHYTADQLRQAYPEIETFFRAKEIYDPNHLFTNTFYNKYAPLILNGGLNRP